MNFWEQIIPFNSSFHFSSKREATSYLQKSSPCAKWQPNISGLFSQLKRVMRKVLISLTNSQGIFRFLLIAIDKLVIEVLIYGKFYHVYSKYILWYALELPGEGDFKEYPQHIF